MRNCFMLYNILAISTLQESCSFAWHKIIKVKPAKKKFKTSFISYNEGFHSTCFILVVSYIFLYSSHTWCIFCNQYHLRERLYLSVLTRNVCASVKLMKQMLISITKAQVKRRSHDRHKVSK